MQRCNPDFLSAAPLRSVIGKKLSKPTFLQCQFVGQDVVRTFKKYGIKWNVVGKNGLKGDRLLTVTLE